MPIDPSGTRPISTLRPDSRSVTSEPVPMPNENTASRNVTTPSSPPRFSRANGVKLVRKIEPKNQSHEMPRIELKTAGLVCAIRRLAAVSRDRIPVDPQVRVRGGRQRNELGRGTAERPR